MARMGITGRCPQFVTRLQKDFFSGFWPDQRNRVLLLPPSRLMGRFARLAAEAGRSFHMEGQERNLACSRARSAAT